MKRLFGVLLFVLLGFFIVGCNKEKTEEIEIDEVFEIHTQSQKDFLANEYKYIILYAKGVEELSKPNPIKLTWNINTSTSKKLHLSEDKSFSVVREFVTNDNEIEIYNLKINTVYYWYVLFEDDSKTDTKTFIIESDSPRNLNIEGLTNARDLGGYETSDGKRTNQGLIYRSSRLNENETTTLLISESGIKEMVEVLNIKTELDIRRTENNENGGITSSPLGSSVNYISIPMESGGNCILLNKDILKDAFAVLGNEENYPLVIHCSIGTDRTGMLCFLINALLGVSEEDLYKDYLFSNFGNIGGSRAPSTIDTYIKLLRTSTGDTLAEKTYNYLTKAGVSEEDLNNLIKIMTE